MTHRPDGLQREIDKLEARGHVISTRVQAFGIGQRVRVLCKCCGAAWNIYHWSASGLGAYSTYALNHSELACQRSQFNIFYRTQQ